MTMEKTHSTQELLLAIALRKRAVEIRIANEMAEHPKPEKPFTELLDIAIQEAKEISDFISGRLQKK